MSLSTCEKCGGHIPLGPNATNRCESCGLGVFDAHTDPFPMGHMGEYMLETRNERDRYRATLGRIYRSFEDGETHAVVLAEIAAEALGIATEPPSY